MDDRHCHNGLWDYPTVHGQRPIPAPLAKELRRWHKHFPANVPSEVEAAAYPVQSWSDRTE